MAAAIYLEEYGGRSRVARLIEINIANLAAVPVDHLRPAGPGAVRARDGDGPQRAGGRVTLALLALPVVILSTREALRTVPSTIREGSLCAWGDEVADDLEPGAADGALPGILTGLILSLSRAIGETAPLITIGALTYVPFAPDGIWSPFTVLPIQIFNWVSRPQADFRANAAAGIIVLLVMLLVMNATAILLRDRFQKQGDHERAPGHRVPLHCAAVPTGRQTTVDDCFRGQDRRRRR